MRHGASPAPVVMLFLAVIVKLTRAVSPELGDIHALLSTVLLVD